jgi:membrane associated rhomboid family serine protease
VDGRLAAVVLWDALPYWLRSAWQDRVGNVPVDGLKAYLEREASPVALMAATSSQVLPPELKEVASGRLALMGLAPETLAALETHFRRLVKRPKDALLRHVGSPEKVDPTLDRVDLLAEIIALRDAQHDVRAERQVSRAFEGMFKSREPVVVWGIVALCFGLHLLFSAMGKRESAPILASLRLEAGLERPWTLVSYAFLHLTDLRHVLLNMLALASLGPVLERVLGPGRFLGFYLGAAAFGGLVSIVVRHLAGLDFATVGASAALAGLAGLAVTLGLWFSRRHGRIPLRYTARTLGGGVMLLSNFAIGAANGGANVDHAAHAGGLAFGVAMGLLLIPSLGQRAASRFHLRVGRRMAPG